MTLYELSGRTPHGFSAGQNVTAVETITDIVHATGESGISLENAEHTFMKTGGVKCVFKYIWKKLIVQGVIQEV
jgi:hypothetical protein